MHHFVFQFHFRVKRERYTKRWTPPIAESHKLTDDEIAEFVRQMMPVVELSLFSKVGSDTAARTLKFLVDLRPEIAIPPMLDMYVHDFMNVADLLFSMQIVPCAGDINRTTSSHCSADLHHLQHWQHACQPQALS
jgi:hypothetical protein